MTMTQASIAIGVLEDDDVMRDYLRHTISNEDGFELAFAAATLAEARAALETGPAPDICLVDLQLPDGSGTEFVEQLSQNGHSKALILTVLGDRLSVMKSIESGADGYLLKDSQPELIVQHIRDTIKGASPMSAQAASHLLSLVREQKDAKAPLEKSVLTERETEILALFAKGMSYDEAAQLMGISPHTVRDHVKSIYRKMDVRSKSEAVFEAVHMGWINI
ncbi:response regulator [Oceanicaulis sp. LC35]|uniref:response regulator n=1 Tax=Oceanicaulis sp. LC35 TaxID=3349635 RepID=UPI003F86FA9C